MGLVALTRSTLISIGYVTEGDSADLTFTLLLRQV